MTTQEKYEKYNETVAPSDELIEKTREAMLAAASEAPVKKRKRNGGRVFGRVMSYVGVAAVPGSSFFREPVNHLIRLHFARSEDTLNEALERLSRLPKLL